MMALLSLLGPALAMAAGLGLVAAAMGGPGRELAGSRRPVQLAALAAVAASLGLALSGLVPGRPGLWLDIAAPLAAAYALGCVAGAGLRRLVGRMRRPPAPPPAVDGEARSA